MREDVRDRPDAGLDRALAEAFAFVAPPAAVGAVEQRKGQLLPLREVPVFGQVGL